MAIENIKFTEWISDQPNIVKNLSNTTKLFIVDESNLFLYLCKKVT
jgi:hypothetical protein